MLDRTPASDPGSPPDDLAETWWLVRTAVHRVEYAMAARLARDGIEGTGVPEALAALAAGPDHQLTMAELATAVGLTTGGVTRLVDRLAQSRLVARGYSATDRRVVYARLTEEGLVEERRAAQVYAAALRERFAGLSPEHLAFLRDVTGRLARPLPGTAAAETRLPANGPRRRGGAG